MSDNIMVAVIAKPKRGRRPAEESKAKVIRHRLIAWRETPEHQRGSLRALATELGTSHQLLSFYLKDLDRWQQKEYKREAKSIRDRAAKEKRHKTPWEHSQVENLEMSAFYCMVDKLLADQFAKIEREIIQGKPATPISLRVLKTLAAYGHLEAQATLRRIMAGSGKRNPAPTPGV